jgi:metal-responsive CopG/Arc/MetJ family transcriptional regulator
MNSGKYGRETEVVEVDFCDDVLDALDDYALEEGYNTREAAVRAALER